MGVGPVSAPNRGLLVARPVCVSLRKDGAACRAPAVPGSDQCWVHDEAWADRAREGRALGAIKAGKLRSMVGRRPRLDNGKALAAWLSNLLIDVLEGKTDPDIAKVLFYGASVQRGVVELVQRSEVERRLAEVEKLLAQRRAW
jgi:hypothetical protein